LEEYRDNSANLGRVAEEIADARQQTKDLTEDLQKKINAVRREQRETEENLQNLE
jgi:ABC-type transporter Mla subunit MlaD